MSASGRFREKRTFSEWPENFHKIDQLGTSAFHSEADTRLELGKGSANDPTRIFGAALETAEKLTDLILKGFPASSFHRIVES